MADVCKAILEQRRNGISSSLYSVCSSHMMVIEAAIRRVALHNKPIAIEATANQVNQHGGYTGMTPSIFFEKITALMNSYHVSKDLVVFGGDHLGPYPWRKESATIAMTQAEVLVRLFVAAGARKIHLDTSMALKDDTSEVLDPELIAKRSALLCLAAEDEFSRLQKSGILSEPPIYIIGTEVPVPGGEVSPVEIIPTTKESFEHTYEIHKKVFSEFGLDDAFHRVMAVVVQPGVDFDSHNVFPFDSAKIVELRDSLNNKKDVFFEAHSTDYQSTEALRELVKNKCIFLKVGPALTFAYREALFGLSQVARYFDIPSHVAHLDSVMFEHMKKDPTHWSSYYEKDDELTLLYSLSDRIRYYWDTKEVMQVVGELIERMSAFTIPAGLVAQYFPRLGGIENIVKNIKRLHPRDLIMSSIDAELERYEIACSPDRNITHEDN